MLQYTHTLCRTNLCANLIHPSAWKVNSAKFDDRRAQRRQLLGASSFEGQPHRIVLLVPPRVTDTQMLHYGFEAIPHSLAVSALKPQRARDLFVGPPLDDHLCACFVSRERA